ncbi:MAG TPA: TetR/AcrR family transcriptional regulator [Bryobacteraceae bacterium]|nr:TetR/AcrR family transcriptional regulator [Bryobacteraceae bacterium]
MNGQLTTRDRILDAAEELFAHQGFDATSLREITSAAGVNLAAVNYHFQSKEALLKAVVGRRLTPLNERRLSLLDEIERTGQLTLETIFEALIVPVLELHAHAPNFVPIMGRVYTAPGALVELVIREHMKPVSERFVPVLQRALPHLSPIELMWRIQFTIGAVSHVMAGSPLIRAISGGICEPSDTATVRRQLMPYVLAGFSAPAPKEHS